MGEQDDAHGHAAALDQPPARVSDEADVLRIAFITNVPAPYRSALFERLAGSPGCELLVVYESAGEPNRDWSAPREATFEHVVLDSVTLNLSALSPDDAFMHIPRGVQPVLRAFAPDVVVAGGAGIWSSPANLATILGRRRPPGARSWAIALWWESPARRRVRRRRRLVDPWVRAVVGRAEAWIACGSDARQRVLSLGAVPGRTVVAPNAAPAPSPPLPPTARPRDPCRFLYVGQLIERKGVRQLLRAFEQAGLGTLTLVGDGPLRAEVEDFARHHDDVEFRGPVPHEEIGRAYDEHDVLVLPAVYDVWGMVVNEALAHGLQVIATDGVGAATDLVRPGQNGLVATAGSARSLTGALQTAAGWSAGDYARAAEISSRLLETWSVDRAADEIIHACRLAHRQRAGAGA
jgi:glycosyltransferase involved in cell wall biosynthesis